jgi:hypothetical protein
MLIIDVTYLLVKTMVKERQIFSHFMLFCNAKCEINHIWFFYSAKVCHFVQIKKQMM